MTVNTEDALARPISCHNKNTGTLGELFDILRQIVTKVHLSRICDI